MDEFVLEAWYPGDVVVLQGDGGLRRATSADDPETLLVVLPNLTLQNFQEAMNGVHVIQSEDGA